VQNIDALQKQVAEAADARRLWHSRLARLRAMASACWQ
jgi:hypothetical protein